MLERPWPGLFQLNSMGFQLISAGIDKEAGIVVLLRPGEGNRPDANFCRGTWGQLHPHQDTMKLPPDTFASFNKLLVEFEQSPPFKPEMTSRAARPVRSHSTQ